MKVVKLTKMFYFYFIETIKNVKLKSKFDIIV